MRPAFISWSGGKDCSLACYMATQNGFEARYLLNMIGKDGTRSRSHGMSSDVLKKQAEAMGIALVQQPTEKDDYEENYKNALRRFKEESISDGVFGDIDFNAHLEWIERVCKESGMTPNLPLWEWKHDKIMDDFIGLGFESVVVTTKPDKLGKEWLGRKVDREFLKDLEKLGNVTLCGEAGEFHTFVINGPLFNKRIEILESEKVFRDERWFLDIGKIELRDK